MLIGADPRPPIFIQATGIEQLVLLVFVAGLTMRTDGCSISQQQYFTNMEPSPMPHEPPNVLLPSANTGL